jgi:hypothetical protein
MKKRTQTEIELYPDAWARFERAVDAAVKSGPKHRVKPDKKPAGRQQTAKRSTSKRD